MIKCRHGFLFLEVQRLNFMLVRKFWQECRRPERAERAHIFPETIAFCCCLTCDEFWEVNGANDRNRSVCLCSSWGRGSVFFLCRQFSWVQTCLNDKKCNLKYGSCIVIKKLINSFLSNTVWFNFSRLLTHWNIVWSNFGHLTMSERLTFHGDRCRKHFTIALAKLSRLI